MNLVAKNFKQLQARVRSEAKAQEMAAEHFHITKRFPSAFELLSTDTATLSSLHAATFCELFGYNIAEWLIKEFGLEHPPVIPSCPSCHMELIDWPVLWRGWTHCIHCGKRLPFSGKFAKVYKNGSPDNHELHAKAYLDAEARLQSKKKR